MNRGAVDIGNTRIKAGIFDNNGKLLKVDFFDDTSSTFLWLEKNDVKDALISDVKGTLNALKTTVEIKLLDTLLKLPFTNLYKTPETLGADRVAVMAAAASIFPGKASLVFDIGTCMTIDLLHPDNAYYGGNISPGLHMRLKAMHHFTGQLPLAEIKNMVSLMGNDTLSALANGALYGLLHEIEGYILKTKEEFQEVNILLCGGDAHYFEKQLKYKIFADQNLVLLGLYHLLVFND